MQLQPIFKVLSRKFLVTAGALFAIFSSGDTSVRLWIIAGVAALYVITEGLLDARGMPALARELGAAIKAGIDKGEELTSAPASEPAPQSEEPR